MIDQFLIYRIVASNRGQKAKSICIIRSHVGIQSNYNRSRLERSNSPYDPDMVYRWVRLPMGLTGAGSHFQSCLTVEVQKNLLYKIIELYLDDGIVPAEDDDKFTENLRLVFQRFLEHNYEPVEMHAWALPNRQC